MAIIIISRASYSHGRTVAEKVAQELNYNCISREVISLAAEEYGIPEKWLKDTIEKGPSILDRFTYEKKKYITYIRSALLEYAIKDNLVYHDFVGTFLLKGIPNILRVLVSATIEERVREMVKKLKISGEQARKNIEKFDRDRKKWAMFFHGRDPWDIKEYDLGIVIGRLSIDDAVKKIIETAKLPSFQITDEVKKILMDEYLATKVKSDLMNFYSDVEVTADSGIVTVHLQRSIRQQEAITEDIRSILMEIPEIKEVRINIVPI